MIDLQEHGIELDCGVTRQMEAPDTFELPCRPMRQNMKIGMFAKLIFIGRHDSNTDDFGAERMWVKVTKEDNGDGYYEGTLANQPFCENLAPLEFGSKIEFDSSNVIDIMEGEK
jgi:hypothetical protein